MNTGRSKSKVALQAPITQTLKEKLNKIVLLAEQGLIAQVAIWEMCPGLARQDTIVL